MLKLKCCYLQVFGSNFNANDFSIAIGGIGSVKHNNKAYDKSPIKALRLGNVQYWQSEEKYFDSHESTNVFTDYLCEHEFIISFLRDYEFMIPNIKKYYTHSTEVWLNAIYTTNGIYEEMSGYFLSQTLITELAKFPASFSSSISSI